MLTYQLTEQQEHVILRLRRLRQHRVRKFRGNLPEFEIQQLKLRDEAKAWVFDRKEK